MEATINDLQTQINEQEQEAETAIAKWQESCSSLEHEKGELIQKLETTSEMEGSIKRALDEAKDNLKNDEEIVVKWQGESVFTVELREACCRSFSSCWTFDL